MTMLLSLILALALLPAPSKVFLWTYATADIEAGEVNRFELQIDDGAWTDVGRMASADQSGGSEGLTVYETPVPALKLGAHTASVRACNPVECSDAVTLPFVISIRPNVVKRVWIGGEQ
jgi:hypothetical protein